MDGLAGRHNIRSMDIMDQIGTAVVRTAGEWSRYREPVADNGLPDGARAA